MLKSIIETNLSESELLHVVKTISAAEKDELFKIASFFVGELLLSNPEVVREYFELKINQNVKH